MTHYGRFAAMGEARTPPSVSRDGEDSQRPDKTKRPEAHFSNFGISACIFSKRELQELGEVFSMSGSSLPRQTQVIVLTEDPLTEEGVTAYLTAHAYVDVLTPDTVERPDILLIIATEITDKIFTRAEQYAQESAGQPPRLVLIANSPTPSQLARAVELGLTAFVPRRRVTLTDIDRALSAVARGGASLPQPLVRCLLEQIRDQRWKDQDSHEGDTPAALTAREIAVLRQLAAGFNTSEIAAALHYSERTVKNIIHQVITRCDLRNRVHAVAFALQRGLL
ncbi:response regulator transcription factor [Streptomyces sp. NPDC002265]|uniref:helix-turn-helix transcriptional regulator n=1 Tax=Streptomyces sp. NPDC002265 TaxID=3154415 RepID=UPI00331FD70D